MPKLSRGQPLEVRGDFNTVNGDATIDGDILAGTNAAAGTGGNTYYGRHLWLNVVGGVHWWDLNVSLFELARLMPDGNPAAAMEFKVGPESSPLSIIAWSIDIATGAMHLPARLAVDEGADFAKAGGVTLSGQSTTSGLVVPLTIQAKNNSGTVVSSITFGSTGVMTVPNNSSLDIPLVVSGGSVRANGFGTSTEINKGTVTSSVSIDWAAGANQRLTLTTARNCTISFSSNPPTIGWVTLKTISPASGTVPSITWPASVKWAAATKPAQATTLGRANVQRLYWDGTNYWGDAILNAA